MTIALIIVVIGITATAMHMWQRIREQERIDHLHEAWLRGITRRQRELL